MTGTGSRWTRWIRRSGRGRAARRIGAVIVAAAVLRPGDVLARGPGHDAPPGVAPASMTGEAGSVAGGLAARDGVATSYGGSPRVVARTSPATRLDDGSAWLVGQPAPGNAGTASVRGRAEALGGGFATPAGQGAAGGDEPTPPRNAASYGLWVLMPAVVAILLAIVTRQVVPALVVGVLVGSYMMVPCLPAEDSFSTERIHPVIGGFRLFAERYVMGSVMDIDHVKIVIFTLVIGFMVGVIGRNGGTAGLVRLVAGDTRSARRGGITAWAAGLVVFFDDYANTMIVGPTMRSVFDKLRISRAKLAYIVDSTAAPVASIALIGTWVGAEVGFIDSGLSSLGSSRPAFLSGVEPMTAFLASIPYRFYPILALVLVFLVVLTGRDFGPMRRSEQTARDRLMPGVTAGTVRVRAILAEGTRAARWWLGLGPVVVLVGVTVAVLIKTGLASPDVQAAMSGADWAEQAWWQRASVVLSAADSGLSIFYGAIVSAFAAMLLTMVSRACSVREAADAGLEGMSRMFPAIVILVLAWSLSAALNSENLMLGEIATAKLRAIEFSAHWLPLAVFVSAALISFSTGTSWGTMGILCPATVTISAGLCADLDPGVALGLFYAAVGSVLAGAVFGDHCSPISDTTVLSSIAAECPHEEHVWTQLPYALAAAVVGMGVGETLCSVYGQPWYYGLLIGCVLLTLMVLVVGRKPEPVPPPPMPPPVSRIPPRPLGATPSAEPPANA
ncbi:MAG: Na+/H+ antiporter NhaC family protein [Phycisphaerae bacterium]